MAPMRLGDGTSLRAKGYSQVRKGDGTELWNAIPDSGVSRWTFDTADTENGVALDVWGEYDGDINGPTTGIPGANQTYDTNEAYEFDGDDDYIDYGDHSAHEFSSGQSFTFAFWQYQDSGSSNGSLITKGYGNPITNVDNQPWYLSRTGQGGYAEFFLRDSNGADFKAQGNTDITDSWTHTVAVYDASASELKLYVNGSIEDTVTGVSDDSYGQNSSPLVSGPHVGEYGGFKIDDLRIYSKPLTSTEVSNLYQSSSI